MNIRIREPGRHARAYRRPQTKARATDWRQNRGYTTVVEGGRDFAGREGKEADRAGGLGLHLGVLNASAFTARTSRGRSDWGQPSCRARWWRIVGREHSSAMTTPSGRWNTAPSTDLSAAAGALGRLPAPGHWFAG